MLAFSALVLAGCGDDPVGDGSCTPDDANGIDGDDTGPATFIVTVNDDEFAPAILSVENNAEVTLTLTNEGTRAHGFQIDCLPTPNDDNCPLESCFPDEARILPIDPGETKTIVFETPLVEGLYTVRSRDQEDTPRAQIIIE